MDQYTPEGRNLAMEMAQNPDPTNLPLTSGGLQLLISILNNKGKVKGAPMQEGLDLVKSINQSQFADRNRAIEEAGN